MQAGHIHSPQSYEHDAHIYLACDLVSMYYTAEIIHGGHILDPYSFQLYFLEIKFVI